MSRDEMERATSPEDEVRTTHALHTSDTRRHANELPNFRRPSFPPAQWRGRANTLLRQLIPLSPLSLAVHNLLQRQGRDASLPLRPREPVQTLLRQEHSGTQLTDRFRRSRVSEISLTISIQIKIPKSRIWLISAGGGGRAEPAAAVPRVQRQDPACEEQLAGGRGRRPSRALDAQRPHHAQVRLRILPRQRHAPLAVQLLHVLRCMKEKMTLSTLQ